MKKVAPKNHKLIVVVVGMLLAALGFFLYKSLLTSPQVALLETGSCVTNVASFTLTDSCGIDMVKRVDYTCKESGQVGYEGGGLKDCLDVYLAFEHAQAFCGQTCTIPKPSFTPTPTPFPTITPTSTPYPSISPTYIPYPSAYPTPVISPSPTFTPKPRPSVPPTSKRCYKLFGRTYCIPIKKQAL